MPHRRKQSQQCRYQTMSVTTVAGDAALLETVAMLPYNAICVTHCGAGHLKRFEVNMRKDCWDGAEYVIITCV